MLLSLSHLLVGLANGWQIFVTVNMMIKFYKYVGPKDAEFYVRQS